MNGFDVSVWVWFSLFFLGYKDTRFLSQVTPYLSICGEPGRDEEAIALARLRFGASAPDSGER